MIGCDLLEQEEFQFYFEFNIIESVAFENVQSAD